MAVKFERTGMLLIISAPPARKGHTGEKADGFRSQLPLFLQLTTRKPRDNEIEGVHYHFVTEEAFDRLVSENAFLEHATVHGHHYGTLRAPVERLMAEGFNVLLDIDPQGAITVMQNADDYVSVFILPPSFEDLRVRLHTRNTDDPVEIERRLKNARVRYRRSTAISMPWSTIIWSWPSLSCKASPMRKSTAPRASIPIFPKTDPWRAAPYLCKEEIRYGHCGTDHR